MTANVRYVGAACLMVLGCGVQDDDRRVFGTVRDSMPIRADNVEIASLGTACAQPVAERRTLVVTASVMPPGFREAPGPNDAEWNPSVVTDLTTIGQAVFVLDGAQQEVTKLNAALEVVRVIGREGGGPGEFRRPNAIGATAEAKVLVSDPANGRVTIIDPLSFRTLEHQVPGLTRTSGIAAVAETLYSANAIVPEVIRRSPRNGVVLTSVSIDGQETNDLLDLAKDTAAAEALLRLPGPNQFRVVASAGLVMLIAPAAGTIDLIKNGRVVRRVQHCVPTPLRTAYGQQLERYRNGSGPNFQRMQPIVTDAMVSGDTLFVIGPLRDPDGDLHLTKYTLSGELLGSTAARLGDEGFPRDIRFWGEPYIFVAFGMQGTLLRVEMQP